jgi:hypothetical protein
MKFILLHVTGTFTISTNGIQMYKVYSFRILKFTTLTATAFKILTELAL